MNPIAQMIAGIGFSIWMVGVVWGNILALKNAGNDEVMGCLFLGVFLAPIGITYGWIKGARTNKACETVGFIGFGMFIAGIFIGSIFG